MTAGFEAALDCIKRAQNLLVRYENARDALPVAWRDAFRNLSSAHVPQAAQETYRILSTEMERLVERVNGVPRFVAGVTDPQIQQLLITYHFVAGVVLLSLSYWLKFHDPAAEVFQQTLASWLPFGNAPPADSLVDWTPKGRAS